MDRYEVTLTGTSPLLMHADDVQWGDALKAWRDDPANKGQSVAGDDRSPAWTWIGYCYHDGAVLGIPSDNLMTAFRDGGVLVPSGKGKGTLKRATQSGILVDQVLWPLTSRGTRISIADVQSLSDERNFTAMIERARKIGIELFVKRAKIGTSKHVRVRPRWDEWSVTGTITVLDSAITRQKLEALLAYSGRYAGVCDWRPGSPKSPGPFGMFEAKVREA